MTASAVLFDFDGTLFDLEWDLTEIRDQLSAAGAAPGPVLDQIDGLNGPLRARFQRVFDAHELAAVARGRFLPFALDTLDAAARRVPVAIVTRNAATAVSAAFKAAGHAAPLIVGREHVSRMKPDPEGLLLALRQLSRTAGEEVLVVGDTTHDVEAAHAIGATCVVVENVKLSFQPTGAEGYVDRISDIVGWV